MFSKRSKEIFHLTFLRHAAIYFICNMLKCKHIQRQISIYISLFFFYKICGFCIFYYLHFVQTGNNSKRLDI